MIILAQTADWIPVLSSAGVAGVVLAWFMLRLEGIIKANTAATERMTRTQLLLVLSLKQADASAKDEARQIMREREPDFDRGK